MNGKDIITLAGEQFPTEMQKVAGAIAYLEKQDPGIAQEVIQDISDISNYAAEKFEKMAEGYGTAARFGAAIGGALVTGLIGSAMPDIYDAAKRGVSKNHNFKNIMELNPELKGYDKARIRHSYDALHRFAPDFTADPIVGGSLLKAVADNPGNEPVVLRDLINSRKNLRDVKNGQFRMGPMPTLDLESKGDAERRLISRDQFAYSKARDMARDLQDAARDARETKQRAEDTKARQDSDIKKERIRQATERMRGSNSIAQTLFKERLESWKADKPKDIRPDAKALRQMWHDSKREASKP